MAKHENKAKNKNKSLFVPNVTRSLVLKSICPNMTHLELQRCKCEVCDKYFR